MGRHEPDLLLLELELHCVWVVVLLRLVLLRLVLIAGSESQP